MTNVAFTHHKYLELFTHTVPKSIIDYIIKTKNGEDLTMNVVIGKYLTELGHPMCVGIHVTFGYKEVRHLASKFITQDVSSERKLLYMKNCKVYMLT